MACLYTVTLAPECGIQLPAAAASAAMVVVSVVCRVATGAGCITNATRWCYFLVFEQAATAWVECHQQWYITQPYTLSGRATRLHHLCVGATTYISVQ